MDVWAAGCVFYEILTLRPLFPGSSELDQINRVHNVLGPPPNKILQKFSKHAEIERDYSRHTSKQARIETIKKVLGDMKNSSYEWYFSGTGKEPNWKGVDTLLPTHVTTDAKDLLKHLLQYDPDSRPSSHRALQHAYFKDLREQAQRAAREKLPATSGPIVTIVGDEGGLEVAADDNANPVDLTTLGDGKLKLKAPIRRSSGIKEMKENLSSTRKGLRKDLSAGRISQTTYESPTSILKEAGEMCSKAEMSTDKKLTTMSTTIYEPKRTEESVKLVERTMANLRLGGDFTPSSSSLSYQKMYLGGDEEGKDSLSSTIQLLDTKRKINSSHLNKRRGGSKLMEDERKKCMTIMSSTSGAQGFPLDFIDKTSLTPDVLVRINENRRIAHMQPIVSSDLKKIARQRENQSHSKEQQLYYFSKSPRSPFEFSPRNYHHQQQQKNAQQKPVKGDHNQMYNYNFVKGNTHLNKDAHVHNSCINKQVRELLASLSSRKVSTQLAQQQYSHDELIEYVAKEGGQRNSFPTRSHELEQYDTCSNHIQRKGLDSSMPQQRQQQSTKSKAYIDEYDSTSSLSPSNIRQTIEHRRKVEPMTTETDGDGDTYSGTKVQNKLESSRRKRMPRFSTDSNSNHDPVAQKNVSEFSIQSYMTYPQHVEVIPKYQKNQDTVQNRVSPIQPYGSKDFTNSNSNTNSSNATKQVRDVLAEMRKRRDMLEDRVTKEPTLQNWIKKSVQENTTMTGQNSMKISPKSKISESVKRSQNFSPLNVQRGTGALVRAGVSEQRERRVNEDIISSHIGSSTYRFNSNNNANSIKNSYQTHSSKTHRQVKQLHNQQHLSPAELSPMKLPDKLNSLRHRKQLEQVYTNKMKAGRQPSIIVKYLDSEPKIKGTRKSPTTESPKNTSYHQQSQTGAASKIFPRNRWENYSFHHKQ